MIDDRKARIARDLDDATEKQQQADAAAAAHEKTLAEARANAQALAQSARDGAAAAEAETRRKALDGRAWGENRRSGEADRQPPAPAP